MKFRVTGGPEGDRGISVGTRRYEPGDVLDMPQQKAKWLVDKGLLEPNSSSRHSPEPADDTAEDEVSNYENAVEDSAAEEID